MKVTDIRTVYSNVPLKALSPLAIGGAIDVPEGPGLGIEVASDRLAQALSEAAT